jgi:hypothetical protein
MADNFKQFYGKEDTLPMDAHMLLGLIAPRAVLLQTGSIDHAADSKGEFLSEFSTTSATSCTKVGTASNRRLAGLSRVSQEASPSVPTKRWAGHCQTNAAPVAKTWGSSLAAPHAA